MHVAAEASVEQALRPWARRLLLEAVGHWLVRGAIVGLVVASAIMAVGWVVPWPESVLQPVALQAALVLLLTLGLVALWPVGPLRRAAQLDDRLGCADRLATAWINRQTTSPMLALQRADALDRLARRDPRRDLRPRWRRTELIALAAVALLAAVFALVPSPMQRVLQQQAQDQLEVQAAAQELEALQQEVSDSAALTPDQARRLQELLQQARDQLAGAENRDQAQAVLSSVAQQATQLGDPNADALDEALAAMSETLTQEPLTRALGNAVARNDRQAAQQAVQQLQAQADQLSDIQRQALARALQRAANVSRGDQRSASALREAASALGNGESGQAELSSAADALQAAMQSSAAQAELRSTSQRVQDVRNALASGIPRRPDALGDIPVSGAPSALQPSESATPVALDASAAGRLRPEPGSEQGPGAGIGAGQSPADQAGAAANPAQPAENIFVPGQPSGGPSDQENTLTPFTVRGAPRPYREVIGQYAQTGREYVDRAGVPPNVREMVKQYLDALEEGQ